MNAVSPASTGLAVLAAVSVLAAATAVRPRRAARALAQSDDAASNIRAGRINAYRIRRQQQHAIAQHFPSAVELVVLAVRAGHLPFAAMQASAPLVAPCLRPAFARVVAQVHSGARFADALSALPELLGPPAQPLASALAGAERYGLPLAPVLDRLAADAHADRRRQLEALSRQLPVRLSLPLVLCTLPAFVLMAVVPLLLAALASLRT